MTENKKNSDWQPAVLVFSEVSAWIAMPIILALIAGKALDARYGTEPVIFLVLAGVGFLVSSFGIVRTVKNYSKKLEKTKDEEKK